MDEYVTVSELCNRIKYRRQTIYNLIHKKTFILGKHFLKPTPKKLLFKWSEIQAWIGEIVSSEAKALETPNGDSAIPRPTVDPQRAERGLIRI
jgi:hypothetical protein